MSPSTLILAGFACGLTFAPISYSLGRAAARHRQRHVLREARYVVKAEKRHNDLLGQPTDELGEAASDILHDETTAAEEEMIVSIVRLDCALNAYDGNLLPAHAEFHP